jgi:hypothetical protein
MPNDTYNCRLNTVNFVVSLITVLIPAIDWVLHNHKELNRAEMIFDYLENISLAASCFILVWGFQRLIKMVQSAKDDIVNKSMIFWHIVAYFFILTANIVQCSTSKKNSEYY